MCVCVYMCVCACVVYLGKDRLKLEAELKAVNEKVKETDAGSAEKLRQVRSRLGSDLAGEVSCFVCPLCRVCLCMACACRLGVCLSMRVLVCVCVCVCVRCLLGEGPAEAGG